MLAQLIKQHQQQPDFTESVHDIIMEQTDNGRTIVEFLLSVMNGELPGFKECHRMEAVRLLEKLGRASPGTHHGIELAGHPQDESAETRAEQTGASTPNSLR